MVELCVSLWPYKRFTDRKDIHQDVATWKRSTTGRSAIGQDVATWKDL